MITPEFNKNQNTWEIDVPGDNSCLFWAVALAYLIPVKDNEHRFQERFKKLFGKKSLGKLEEVKNWIRKYNPFSRDEATHKDQTLHGLVRRQFRRQVIDYTEDNEGQFKGHIEGSFNAYLLRMRDPSSWGGEPEIRAMSDLLDCRIQVITNQGVLESYGEEGGTFIQLFHVGALPDSSKANHYHFALEKSLGDTYQRLMSSSQSVDIETKTKYQLVVEEFQQQLKQPSVEKEIPQSREERAGITINVNAVSGKNNTLYVNTMNVIGMYKGPETNVEKRPIWFDMRESVKLFTGRNDELKYVHYELQSKNGQVVVSQMTSVSGLGGIGKSELARKYAYDYRKDYDGNAIWINAETQESLRKSFQRLAKELNIPTTEMRGGKEQEMDIKSVVNNIYQYFRQVKSLFILDNAEEYTDIHEFLPSSLSPDGKKPYVLITSRNQNWEVGEEGEIEVVKLKEFTLEEATRFIKKALNIENKAQDGEIKELTETLQHFPLALGQAVAYIRERNEQLKLLGKAFGISNYLEAYEKEAKKLLDFKSKYLSDRYTKTTYITWKVTLESIAQKEYGKQALKILEIMAYLDPDNVPIERLFLGLVGDEERLLDAAGLLNQYSMISVKEGVSNMHRLVQQVIRIGLQEAQKEEAILRETLVLISGFDNEAYSHVAFVWGYASVYGRLIDDFYFESFYYGENTPLHVLSENGYDRAIKAIVTYLEKSHRKKLRKVIDARSRDGSTPLHSATGYGQLGVVRLLIEKGANVKAKDKNGNTPLHRAAENGHLAIVTLLIEKDADVNANAKNVHTPLHSAAQYDHWEVVKLLIEKGADVHVADNRRWTPLYGAAKIGNLALVKYLIEVKGVGLNVPGEYGKTPLHEAARHGHLDVVKYLMEEKGADAKCTDERGNMPLHLAAEIGNLTLVKYLIGEKCADVNKPNTFRGATPLNLAAEIGHLDVVKYLIEEKGADFNIPNCDGYTPLHWTALTGHLDMVKLLIAKGADVQALSRLGDTPLYFASRYGHLDVVKYLIEKKGGGVKFANKDGKTPLDWAAENGHLDVAQLLLAKGADINVPNQNGMTPLYWAAYKGQLDVVKLLIAKGADVNVTDKTGCTPLHWAAFNGHLDVIKLLIANGGDVKVANKDGETPLHTAAENEKGHLDVVQYLIEEKGVGLNVPGKYGKTPLHFAAYNGKLVIVKLLIAKGADVNVTDEDGSTPLHLAIYHDHLSVVQLLIAKGADFNVADKNSSTPLHLAADNGYLDVAQLLLAKGADVNVTDENGCTPLHLATHHDHLSVVQLLIAKGADFNVADKNGNTPLHLTADNDELAIVKLLIEKGANAHARNKKGKTPLGLAKKRKYRAIIRLLTPNPNLCQIQHYKKQQNTFLHLSQFVYSYLARVTITSVKQGLYLPSFETRGVEIKGKCAAITRAFSQMLFIAKEQAFLSNLDRASPIYECLVQGKQVSDREKKDTFALSQTLDQFEAELDKAQHSLPLSLIYETSYHPADQLADYIIKLTGDFAMHLVIPKHVVAVYRKGSIYAYFDSNVAFLSNIRSMQQLISILKKAISYAGYKVAKEGFLIEHFAVTKANQQLLPKQQQALSKPIQTERDLLSLQDEQLGHIQLNGHKVFRVTLYDLDTKVHFEGSIPVLINADMGLNNENVAAYAAAGTLSITASAFLAHIANREPAKELSAAIKAVPFVGSRNEVKQAQQAQSLLLEASKLTSYQLR